jgi:hypothetical protein
MKRAIQCVFIIMSIITMQFLVSCNKDSTNKNANNASSDALHLSFNTPDWNANINCDQLQLDATTSGLLSAQSQSTKASFYFSVPKDSSEWMLFSNLKKYPIGFDTNFYFNQTLPYNSGSSTRLIGINQYSSDSSYNEITSIKYSNSDNTGAYFIIKANYKMMMKVLYSTSNDTLKYVYGDYCFKVKTNKL